MRFSDRFHGERTSPRNHRDNTFILFLPFVPFLIIFEKTVPASLLSTNRTLFFLPDRVGVEWSESDGECDSSDGLEAIVQVGIPDEPIIVDEDLRAATG